MNSPIQWFLLSSCDRRTAHTSRHRIVKQPQSTGPMARSSLTAALLRVIRTSSGVSQSARLLHKACHWHTRITSIRSCRTIPFPSCHGIKNGPGGLPATGTIRSGKEVPTLGSYAPPCAFTITQMRCLLSVLLRPGLPAVLPLAAFSNRYIQLFFSYYSIILKALRMCLAAVDASLRPADFSTDPQLRPSLISIP